MRLLSVEFISFTYLVKKNSPKVTSFEFKTAHFGSNPVPVVVVPYSLTSNVRHLFSFNDQVFMVSFLIDRTIIYNFDCLLFSAFLYIAFLKKTCFALKLSTREE